MKLLDRKIQFIVLDTEAISLMLSGYIVCPLYLTPLELYPNFLY